MTSVSYAGAQAAASMVSPCRCGSSRRGCATSASASAVSSRSRLLLSGRESKCVIANCHWQWAQYRPGPDRPVLSATQAGPGVWMNHACIILSSVHKRQQSDRASGLELEYIFGFFGEHKTTEQTTRKVLPVLSESDVYSSSESTTTSCSTVTSCRPCDSHGLRFWPNTNLNKIPDLTS
jgi:hypothetical protein